MGKTSSIDEPAAERPVRESLDHGPLPRDGWWFPDFVPRWARLLPRELYGVAYTAFSMKWEIAHAIEQVGRPKRGRGRPRLTDDEQDLEFALQIESTKWWLAGQNRRATDTEALRLFLNKRDVERERARLNRIRAKVRI